MRSDFPQNSCRHIIKNEIFGNVHFRRNGFRDLPGAPISEDIIFETQLLGNLKALGSYHFRGHPFRDAVIIEERVLGNRRDP